MSHELSMVYERDGKYYVESSVEPGKVLEGPFDTKEKAIKRSIERSKEYKKPKNLNIEKKTKDLSKGGRV